MGDRTSSHRRHETVEQKATGWPPAVFNAEERPVKGVRTYEGSLNGALATEVAEVLSMALKM